MDGSDSPSTLDLRPKRFCVRCSEFHASEDWVSGCERYLGGKPIRQCKTCGGWHPLDRWPGNCFGEPNWNRSDLPSPQVIRDGLDDVINPLTGKPVTSKRALRKAYARAGVVEIGDHYDRTPTYERETAPQIDKALEADIVKDVKKSIEQLTTDNFSDAQMGNMLRPENAPVEGGFTVTNQVQSAA